MNNIKIADCTIRKTIPGSLHSAWNTPEAGSCPGPVYEYTFYLAKERQADRYHLFFTWDRYERGQWQATENEGSIPITSQLAEVISEDKKVTQDVIKLEDLLESFQETARKLEIKFSESPFYSDLRNDLGEMNECLKVKCYRATLAMAGRILETSLKINLIARGGLPEKDWMVGTLLKKIEESGGYIDPGMKNIWNIINNSRIAGVHAKERVPIPSKNQAYMVCFGVLDTLDRTMEML